MKKTLIMIPLLILLVSCDLFEKSENNSDPQEHNLTILYTNDEHGWMEESESTEGAAKMVGVWKEREGYTEDGPFLILSGGDNWTGPAISTWFKGKSMVEVMNAMNYDASAIGNHEFDFKIDELIDRINEADFPYLSSNITDESGNVPDYIQPFVVKEVNSIKVGIIGLTTTTTPNSTFPDNVRNLRFSEYDDALTATVPLVKDAGAELLVVIAHICQYEMEQLVPTLVDLGISIIGGGHCNELIAKQMDGVLLIEGGAHLRSYAKVALTFDTKNDTIMNYALGTYSNSGGVEDSEVGNVVSTWEAMVDQELAVVVGYTEYGINRYSVMMYNMITDSWLAAYPNADISITNSGGIRQSIPAGDITKEVIVGVLPFDNNIIELELTGDEIKYCIGNNIFGGMFYYNGEYYHPDSTLLVSDSTYRVLTTDYLYIRSDSPFPQFDNDPYYTGMNYHQPTLDYIESFETGPNNPLENHIDPYPRW